MFGCGTLSARERFGLTPTFSEIAKLRRHASHRDATMILMAYRHGLRVAELCALEWRHVVDLERQRRASVIVERPKSSISGTHPLEPDEVAALRRLRKEEPDTVYVFTSSRGDKLSPAGFRKMLSRLAVAAGLEDLRIHPHMLRHTAGQILVDRLPLGMRRSRTRGSTAGRMASGSGVFGASTSSARRSQPSRHSNPRPGAIAALAPSYAVWHSGVHRLNFAFD